MISIFSLRYYLLNNKKENKKDFIIVEKRNDDDHILEDYTELFTKIEKDTILI